MVDTRDMYEAVLGLGAQQKLWIIVKKSILEGLKKIQPFAFRNSPALIHQF